MFMRQITWLRGLQSAILGLMLKYTWGPAFTRTQMCVLRRISWCGIWDVMSVTSNSIPSCVPYPCRWRTVCDSVSIVTKFYCVFTSHSARHLTRFGKSSHKFCLEKLYAFSYLASQIRILCTLRFKVFSTQNSAGHLPKQLEIWQNQTAIDVSAAPGRRRLLSRDITPKTHPVQLPPVEMEPKHGHAMWSQQVTRLYTVDSKINSLKNKEGIFVCQMVLITHLDRVYTLYSLCVQFNALFGLWKDNSL